MRHTFSVVTFGLPAAIAAALAIGPFAAAPILAQAPQLTPAAMRADVAQLRSLMTDVEKSWTPATKALAMARLDSLDRALDTISIAAFEIAVARVVATADNGHSTAPAARRANRFNRIGVRLAPFGTDFVVLRTRPADADLLGARLVAVEGRPIGEVRSVARTLHGGTDAWRDRFVPFTLESPAQLNALGLVRAADAATYRFESLDGRMVERTLTGEAPDSTRPRQGSHRWFYGEPLAGDPTEWRTLRASDQLPWSVQDPTVPFRLRLAPEAEAVVVVMRQNIGSPAFPMPRFLDSARTFIRQSRPRNIVLDLRFNGGGDLNTTRAFMRELPLLVPGRVYVLTSPFTFSAAISSVGYLKQSAPDRVVIVGEEVGDRLEFWAEGAPVPLRNSGIFIGLGRERHDYKDACRAYRDCHGSVVREPISVPTFVPQLAAPWTREAYLAGRDPGLDAVIAHLARDRRM